MTYLGFLLGFLLLPIVLLSVWSLSDSQVKERLSQKKQIILPGYAFLILSSLALVYTTPWDNYLVATRVWWYDPAKVLGITIGWVPLEEYIFFILQPILGGLVLLMIFSRRNGATRNQLQPGVRRVALSISILTWLGALALLVLGIPAGTYLGLELIWAVPVIILQLAFGADILWHYRRILVAVILGLTAYLSLADGIAIQSGVWTIDPEQSLGLLLGGVLPVEEFVFFLLTNIMVGFGFVLIWAPESHERLVELWSKLRQRQPVRNLGS